ncbi:hypothetical protein [Escherichia coli]|uniref:hypothetical protein n=1 Tax=Escherichia coli TaxID=562 RepID=UPI0010782283|nr:hypothetical protein [Escherichia coli]EEC7850389.1 hypothetical protein [Escherichia coli]EEQ2644959.1 hypothetical protein [Escherichia coli]EJC1635171.1 hypothetical protein [Escherichia coli]EJC1790322.1 hypothetical protein [Escherichia coli]MCF4022661.1 hypothetical protein [Escherichia coli]
MFFMPVDLFTPFIEGREKAIDRNWNDLNQANQVERGWLDNDAKQLSNWFKQDSYLDQLQQVRNQTDVSNMNRDLMAAYQPGNLAQAGFSSDFAIQQANAGYPHIPELVNSWVTGLRGNAAEIAAKGTAQQKYSHNLMDALARLNVQKAIDANTLQPLKMAAEKANSVAGINNALGTGTGATPSVTGGTTGIGIPDRYKQGSTANTTSPVSSTPIATNRPTASDSYLDAMNRRYGIYGTWAD